MSKMQKLHQLPEISVEIQIKDGNFEVKENLVLHLYFSRGPTGHNFFMAEIHETAEKGVREGNPIFYCRGAREKDWTRALSFITFLSTPLTFRAADLERYRSSLEQWFFKNQSHSEYYRRAFAHRLCVQIYTEGKIQNLFQPTSWLSCTYTSNGIPDPEMVLERMEKETRMSFLILAARS